LRTSPWLVVDKWRREHPGEEIPDGRVFVQPWPAGPKDKRRDQWIYYQFKADRARRTLRGIDEQVAKAAKAVAGLAPVKRNRFITLDRAVKSVNRELEGPGGAERLRHQPHGLPRRHARHAGVRDQQLPRALRPHRTPLPHDSDPRRQPYPHRRRPAPA
jgi:hypothetical protein